jgi:hypothetical protein
VAGVILNRLDIFGGAARLVKNNDLTATPTMLEDILVTIGANRGTLETGWVDVGATDDGLKMTVGFKGSDWTVDQVRFPVATVVTDGSYKIECNLAEASLENLQFGWDLDTIVSTAAVSGTNVSQRSVPLGIPGAFSEKQLAFIVERPEYGTTTMRYRAYCFYIAARDTVDSAHSYKKTDKVLIPITFNAKPDICRDESDCIGIVLDESIAQAPPCP